jgi:hypothetical protein
VGCSIPERHGASHASKKRNKDMKKIFNNLSNKFSTLKIRLTLALLTGILGGLRAAAAGNGMAGINEATSMVSSYFDPGTKLVYAIGAVVGLIGGIKVYSKWSSGDPDTSKTAASWFGACIFLIVAATILRSFFL